jgi:exodeoxyribonuclease V beta subunit
MTHRPTAFDLKKSPLHGRNLIEASAGTGKTYTLAALFVRLILEKGLRVDQILVVTFTEAATEELRDRIRRRLREACDVFGDACDNPDPLLAHLHGMSRNPKRDLGRLQEALVSFDQAAIFTIHGFCQRTLQEKAFESGALFKTELVTDQQSLLRETVEDFWRNQFIEAGPQWAAWAQRQGAAPGALYQFVRDYHAFDAPRIIPPPQQRTDEADVFEAARSAFERTAATWRDQRESISDLLMNSSALNRGRYRVDWLPNWIAELDQYLAGEDLFPPAEKLEKFSQSAIKGAVKKGEDPLTHSFFEQVENLSEALDALQQCWRQRLIELRRELLTFVDNELPRRKRKQNIRAFDDLLRDLRQALVSEGGDYLARTLRMRYPAALIDEFQDTDPVQYGIFRSIYPDTSALLFLIGDPKQAIYSFRGADIFAYLQATHEIDHHYTLDTNYRSDGPLVQAVQHLFAQHPRPFWFDQIRLTEVHPAPGRDEMSLVHPGAADNASLHLWFMPRGADGKPVAGEAAVERIAESVATEIVRLLEEARAGRLALDGRKVRPGDIAVLARKNAQAALVQKCLRARGVPSVLHGSESLFASHEMEELRLVLAAVADPVRDTAVRAALATEMLGFDGRELEQLAADEDAWNERLDRFVADHGTWARRGFILMANRMLAREGVRERLLAYPDGERRLTNLLHGIELLHKIGLEQHLGMEGLLGWLDNQLNEKPTRDEYQMRLETDEEAVKLITIHRSKGLEYPIVFCPFAWEHSRPRSEDSLLFHDQGTGRLTLDLDPEKEGEHYQWTLQENLAENLRLLYVSVTRARNRCYLLWGAIKQCESSAPAYLFHTADQAGESTLEEQFLRVKEMGDEEMRRQLEQLAAGSGGNLTLSDLPEPDERVWQAPPAEGGPASCREFRGEIPLDWRIASFSSLVAGQGEERLLPDRDPLVLSAPDTGEDEEEPAGGRFDDILYFPRGARPGSCLHEIFEEIDFTRPDDSATQEVIDRKLRLFGFDSQWGEAVHAMVRRVLKAELPGDFGPVCLATLSAEDRLAEMEFHFPAGRVSAPGLRQVFASGDLDVEVVSGPLFGGLEFPPVQGFIKGYIDLVFVQQGRYYLVDWKSNHLGNRRTHYHPGALRRAMVRDHYLLQYHLYSVALHRLLRARLPGYDYDRHFGGVYYLFLRGVAPEEMDGAGIFYDRPNLRLLNALDGFLREGGKLT